MASVLAQGWDWLEHLSQLLPLILVVIIGLLTLLKRVLEKVFEARTSAEREKKGRPEPSVFEEMRRYFEILEGREAPPRRAPPGLPPGPEPPVPAPPAGPPTVRARPRPTRAPRPAPRPAPDRPGGRLPEEAAAELEAVQAGVTVTHAELTRGSAPAVHHGRPGLARITLGRDRTVLRRAVLWAEILDTSRADRPHL